MPLIFLCVNILSSEAYFGLLSSKIGGSDKVYLLSCTLSMLKFSLVCHCTQIHFVVKVSVNLMELGSKLTLQ